MKILKVFTSKNCVPCKVMKPLLKDLDMVVVEIDIDEYPNLAAQNSVRSVPTLKLFENNSILRTKVGGMTRTQLVEFVK